MTEFLWWFASLWMILFAVATAWNHSWAWLVWGAFSATASAAAILH